MAQSTITPILDLGTLASRPTVRIDGKSYEMRTSDEFTYLVYRQYQRQFQRLGVLLKKKRASQAEEKEQVRLLEDVVRKILLAPDAVHARLRDTHRLEIVKAFFSQRPATTRPAVRGRRRAQPTTKPKVTTGAQ